jgi:hypothetical protein
VGIDSIRPQKVGIATSLKAMREVDKIKVPGRAAKNSRIVKALAKAPMDGEWHRLIEMGFTSAEQTARGYNVPGGQWVFGYTHESKEGEMISVLWAKWDLDNV